jgi:hypothetical protein
VRNAADGIGQFGKAEPDLTHRKPARHDAAKNQGGLEL